MTGDNEVPIAGLLRGTVVVLLLLLLIGLGAALSGPWSTSVGSVDVPPPEALPSVTVSAEPMPTMGFDKYDERTSDSASDIVAVILAIVVTLVICGLLVLAARSLRRAVDQWLATRGEEAPTISDSLTTAVALPPIAALHEAAEQAATSLRTAEEPSDAIIAAWLSLEQAAESSGMPRSPAQTPTEFTLVVLDATAAQPQAVQQLLSLYHLARFATTPLTDEHVAAALAALDQLTRDFASRVAVGADATADTADGAAL
jgi:hypothetical protein